jgi:hypothetical protein
MNATQWYLAGLVRGMLGNIQERGYSLTDVVEAALVASAMANAEVDELAVGTPPAEQAHEQRRARFRQLATYAFANAEDLRNGKAE